MVFKINKIILRSQVLLTFLFFIELPVFSQVVLKEEVRLSSAIASNLAKDGFQNIDISLKKKGLILAYENRVYRFSPLALRRVIEITKSTLLQHSLDLKEITFVVKRNNIPEVSSTSKISSGKLGDISNIQFSRKVPPFNKGTSLITNHNTGNFRVELVLRPFLTMELGNLYLEDQFIHLIDLRPKLNLYLWKGAQFTYEFILPISNEFKTLAPQWSVIRPRVVSFTQQFRLPNTTFVNASVGLFSRDRYGASLQAGKYLYKDRILLTGKIGYTGHASYARYDGFEVQKSWAYTKPSYLDYKVGISYWLPKWNTQATIEYGKVLFNRTALFVRCQQKFKEVDVEFFIYQTDQGRNYGMEIGIPIFPKKYWKPKLFSIRPTTHFRYNYLSGFDNSGQINLAREYQAQGMYGDFPQDLNPYFLKNYILGN